MERKKYPIIFFKILEWVCVLLLAIIVLSICYQIVCRIFSIGQGFTEELARLSFILLVYIGAPLVAAEGLQITVDLLFDALGDRWKKVLTVFSNVLILILSLFVIVGLRMLISTNKGIVASSLSWFKMNWIYTAMYVSFALQIVVSIVQSVLCLQNKDPMIDLLAGLREEENFEIEVHL